MVKLEAKVGGFDNLPMRKREIIGKITQEWADKTKIWEKRAQKLEEQNKAFGELIPVSADKDTNLLSAKAFNRTQKYAYTSGLLHKAWVYLNGVKLYPDFIDFQAEQRFEGKRGEVQAENLTYLHRLVRNKGHYEKATKEAQKDLIRGEGWIQRHYIMDKDGKPVRMAFDHVPWHEMRMEYDGTATIRYSEYKPDTFAQKFGKAMLKKVTEGSIITKKENGLTEEKTEGGCIGVVHYVNPATLEEYVIAGANGYFIKDLVDSKFPYIDDEDCGFNPYQRRVFYDPVQDEWHGWGPIDILFGLARLETIIGNSTARRAIDSADAFKVVYSNNPKEAERKYRQWEANRRASGRTSPFFVSDSATGTRMTPQNVDNGNTNANFDFWKNFIIEVATFLTDINFRALVEFAPTAFQDEQRAQLEDRVNLQVLNKNAWIDKQFAIQDMMTLENTTSKFHNRKFYLARSEEEFGPEENIEDFRMSNGELIPREVTVGKFLKEVKDFNYDVSPRLEGAFEDSTLKEILNLKQDMQIMPPGTKAQQKLMTLYTKAAHPKARMEADDFATPAVGAQSDQLSIDDAIQSTQNQGLPTQ